MRPFIGYPKPKTEPISDFSKQKKKLKPLHSMRIELGTCSLAMNPLASEPRSSFGC
uniref:Uncharacterized protein n=1 Tax=Solanum tuberosum TaxID=4113 RepID=M0ZU36_SOLTU